MLSSGETKRELERQLHHVQLRKSAVTAWRKLPRLRAALLPELLQSDVAAIQADAEQTDAVQTGAFLKPQTRALPFSDTTDIDTDYGQGPSPAPAPAPHPSPAPAPAPGFVSPLQWFTISNQGDSGFLFAEVPGLNPPISLVEGQFVTFALDMYNHPFVLRDSAGVDLPVRRRAAVAASLFHKQGGSFPSQ